MPDTPTRFEKLANGFDGLRKIMVGFGATGIVIVAVFAVGREVLTGGIVIDPVVVKAADRPDAPTPELAAQQIARRLDQMQRAGVQEWRRVHVDDGIRPLDLQIPGAPLSLRGAAREVAALVGLAPITLRSALIARSGKEGYSAVMSLAGDHGSTAKCPSAKEEDDLDNIYECIAFNAISVVDPKQAASYMFQREQAECKGLDAGLALDLPNLRREQYRINNRRGGCSFAKTQKLIAKVIDSSDKSDLRWVPFIYGQVHLARGVAFADVGLPQQLPELDQAIGRFLDSNQQMQNSPTTIAILMKAYLVKGIAIHRSTLGMKWDDDPKSLLHARLRMAEQTFSDAESQLKKIPDVRSSGLDALVSRLEGLLIYRRWMIEAHRRTKSDIATVAVGFPAELDVLAKAAARFKDAAYAPASASDLMDWGNIGLASGEFEEAIAKYRRAADLDPANPEPMLSIAIAYIDRFEHRAKLADAGHLLVALGSVADYVAWMSDGTGHAALMPRVSRLLAGVGHGLAFDDCLKRNLAEPMPADPAIDQWKAAAVSKYCVDQAIDGINTTGIRTDLVGLVR